LPPRAMAVHVKCQITIEQHLMNRAVKHGRMAWPFP